MGMNYKAVPARIAGVGLSWKYGPPRQAQAAENRSLGALGNYMPAPRGGAPEPLGDCGCGCGGGCADDLMSTGTLLVVGLIGIGYVLGKAFRG